MTNQPTYFPHPHQPSFVIANFNISMVAVEPTVYPSAGEPVVLSFLVSSSGGRCSNAKLTLPLFAVTGPVHWSVGPKKTNAAECYTWVSNPCLLAVPCFFASLPFPCLPPSTCSFSGRMMSFRDCVSSLAPFHVLAFQALG